MAAINAHITQAPIFNLNGAKIIQEPGNLLPDVVKQQAEVLRKKGNNFKTYGYTCETRRDNMLVREYLGHDGQGWTRILKIIGSVTSKNLRCEK